MCAPLRHRRRARGAAAGGGARARGRGGAPPFKFITRVAPHCVNTLMIQHVAHKTRFCRAKLSPRVGEHMLAEIDAWCGGCGMCGLCGGGDGCAAGARCRTVRPYFWIFLRAPWRWRTACRLGPPVLWRRRTFDRRIERCAPAVPQHDRARTSAIPLPVRIDPAQPHLNSRP